MAKKVFNMQGGLHSAAAYAALENKLHGNAKATADSFVVTAGAGMNASISTGDGLISVDNFNARRIQTTTAETALVPAASASFNRIDSVVAYIDNGVAPVTSVVDNINDILKFAVVAGTAAATPAAPTGAAIQAAIGAGNPYMILADFTLPQNALNLTGITFINRAPIIKDTSGWTLTNEAWSYASWSAGNRIGVINVPSGATNRYTPGMRVRFEQPTGGVKYGIIQGVTSTTITVFFPIGTSFTNEAITYASFSSRKVPQGFNADPTIWRIRVSISETIVRAAGQYMNPSGASISVPAGAWRFKLNATLFQDNATAEGIYVLAGISTSLANMSDPELKVGMYGRMSTISGIEMPVYLDVDKLIATQTTYYINAVSAQIAGTTSIGIVSGYNGDSYFEIINNYL